MPEEILREEKRWVEIKDALVGKRSSDCSKKTDTLMGTDGSFGMRHSVA